MKGEKGAPSEVDNNRMRREFAKAGPAKKQQASSFSPSSRLLSTIDKLRPKNKIKRLLCGAELREINSVENLAALKMKRENEEGMKSQTIECMSKN